MLVDLVKLWTLLATASLWKALPAFGASLPMDTIHLAPGGSIAVAANAYRARALRIYCASNQPSSVLRIFETLEFQLTIDSDDYSQYDGKTPTEVLQHYNEQRSLFSFTLFSQKRLRIQLSPSEPQCIGVATHEPYKVSLNATPLDLWRLLTFGAGIVTFWAAARLAKNSAFYYLAGIVLGVCASLLIIISLVSKLFPRRPMMYGVMIGGWTIGFYVIKQLLDNIRFILLTYREYVIWYLLITSLASFLICYRIGPPRNPRSQDIIKWVLQFIGGVFVYSSSWHTHIMVAIMVNAFGLYYLYGSLGQYAIKLYRRRFPPKRRLLSKEEYYQQGITETERSLAELRKFVNSPECKHWSLMSRLRNPMRFAAFANGELHLRDEEIDDYSRTIEDQFDDPDEEEDYLHQSINYRPPEYPVQRRSVSDRQYTKITPTRHYYASNDDDHDEDEDDRSIR